MKVTNNLTEKSYKKQQKVIHSKQSDHSSNYQNENDYDDQTFEQSIESKTDQARLKQRRKAGLDISEPLYNNNNIDNAFQQT